VEYLVLNPKRNRRPNEQKIKPTESTSISSVHFTLNLPQASRLLEMTIRLKLRFSISPGTRNPAIKQNCHLDRSAA
jgi:hypothetical protein